jgi:hypothetical protein
MATTCLTNFNLTHYEKSCPWQLDCLATTSPKKNKKKKKTKLL